MHTLLPVLHVADNEFGEVLQVGQGGGGGGLTTLGPHVLDA